MKQIILLISTLIIGSTLIACDSNDDAQEVQQTVKEVQATHGEDGNIEPEERKE